MIPEMSNHGYVFDCDEKKIPKRDKDGNIIVLKQNSLDFNSVRNNHSANSALNVLRARESYKAIGFTDAQIDEIAVLVYAHSKSNSGVTDLNNSKSWSDCFDRIEALKTNLMLTIRAIKFRLLALALKTLVSWVRWRLKHYHFELVMLVEIRDPMLWHNLVK